jgi:hypothetical protein
MRVSHSSIGIKIELTLGNINGIGKRFANAKDTVICLFTNLITIQSLLYFTIASINVILLIGKIKTPGACV